jgi:hypothetical protein
MSWNIKGEAAKTLDATVREISTLNIDSATLRFESMANDSLAWSAKTEDATGAGTIVPDSGQVVELWLDSVRKFRGHVLAPKVGTKRIGIEAVGPWWWMTRIPLTSDQVDGVGVTAERANYVFATGDHKTKIETLLSRAITNGVPMRLGTVDAMFDTPNMSLAEMNCGQALAELLAWVPDAVLWFDHTDITGDGTPIANVTRRGTMAATTYALGVDAVIDAEITPRLDLEVAHARLDYVTRNVTTGKPTWATQSAGSLVDGKKQIVTISGPEISAYLPADDFDSYDIQTAATSGAPLSDYVESQDAETAPTGATWSIGNGAAYSLLSNYDYTTGWLNTGSNAQTTSATTFTKKDGTAAVLTGKAILLTEGLPDWVKRELGHTFEEITITGDLRHAYTLNNNLGTSYPSPADNALPSWYASVTYFRTFSGGASVGSRAKLLYSFHRFSVGAVLVDSSWPSLTTLYKPWDYDFLSPPAGLAAALQAAQNWVPWEGPISIIADAVTGNNMLAAKYNLSNALPACATMQTLARSISHSILGGRTIIDLGAPARGDFGTLTSRIRRQPRDNIVNL